MNNAVMRERVCSGVSSSTLTVVFAIALACFVLTSACLNQLRQLM